MRKGETLAAREHVLINRGAQRGAIVTADHKVGADRTFVWIKGRFQGEFLHGRMHRNSVSKLPLGGNGEAITFNNVDAMRLYVDELPVGQLDRVCEVLGVADWPSKDEEERRNGVFSILYDARSTGL